MSEIMEAIPGTLDRLPPHSIEAEMAVLGSLMLCGDDRALFGKIRRLLWKDVFFSADHQIIFEIVCELHDKGVKFDAVTIRSALATRQLLEEIGGVPTLAQLLNAVPSAGHGEHYATIVAERAKERAAIVACNEVIRKLYMPRHEETADEIVAGAIAAMRRLTQVGKKLEIVTVHEALAAFTDKAEEGQPEAIDTGFDDLDKEFRGVLTRGGYTIVGGRPSMGKSSLLRYWLLQRALAGVPCGLIAIEETIPKIAGNYLSATSLLENAVVAAMNYGEHEWQAITAAIGKIGQAPLYLTDAATGINDVLAAADTLVAEYGCRIIGIDHLHLINAGRRYEKKVDELTDTSKSLKHAFKDLKVAGIVAAQLSRPEKAREPAPPRLEDLRECGALEEHCDAALFLHRKDYYHRGEDGYEPDNICQIVIAKNRNGPVGSIKLIADLAHQRFLPFVEEQLEDVF